MKTPKFDVSLESVQSFAWEVTWQRRFIYSLQYCTFKASRYRRKA